MDEVLQKLEEELIKDDKEYKLTTRQKDKWISTPSQRNTHEACPGRIKKKRRRRNRDQITHNWPSYSTFIAQRNSALQPY